MTWRAGAPRPQAPHTADRTAADATARTTSLATPPRVGLTRASALAAGIRLLARRGRGRRRHDVAVGEVRHVDRTSRGRVIGFARDGCRKDANAIVGRQPKLGRPGRHVDGIREHVTRDIRLVAGWIVPVSADPGDLVPLHEGRPDLVDAAHASGLGVPLDDEAGLDLLLRRRRTAAGRHERLVQRRRILLEPAPPLTDRTLPVADGDGPRGRWP